MARDGRILAETVNEIHSSFDPSSHAEMQAIRQATQAAKNPDLSGSTLYASGHPCPMCLAALILAGIERVFYAFDNNDATAYGLSSATLYQRLGIQLEPAPLLLLRLDTGITAAQLYGDAPWPEAI